METKNTNSVAKFYEYIFRLFTLILATRAIALIIDKRVGDRGF